MHAYNHYVEYQRTMPKYLSTSASSLRWGIIRALRGAVTLLGLLCRFTDLIREFKSKYDIR